MSIKNPLTPSWIEPATFLFIAQHLNHCAVSKCHILLKELVQLISLFFFMAQQTPLDYGLLIIKALRSHSSTPHSMGLLCTTDRPDAETSI